MQDDLIIAGIAVAGGLAVGAVAIAVSVPWAMREKLARLEGRSKERLALIEKGYDPERIFEDKKKAGSDPLFWGFLLAGLGLGLFLGYLISLATGWNGEVLINSLGIFSGGVGMIIYHYAGRNKEDQRSV